MPMHAESKFDLYVPLSQEAAQTLVGALRLLSKPERNRQKHGKDITIDDALADPDADPAEVEVARAIHATIYEHGYEDPTQRDGGADEDTIRAYRVRLESCLCDLYNLADEQEPHPKEVPLGAEVSVAINYDYGQWIPLPIATGIASAAQSMLDANDIHFSYVTTGDGGVNADFVFVERGKAPMVVHDYEWGQERVAEAITRREESNVSETSQPTI